MKTRSGSDASFTRRVNSFADSSTSCTRDRDPSRGPVDCEQADLRELDARRAAPQERVDPREQLLVDERARQTVVGTCERPYAGRGVGATEHDHRAVGHDAAVERAGVPEQEDIGIGRARQLLGALARHHVEAVVAQLTLEEAADGGLGLGDEERGHAAESRRGDGRAPDVLLREKAEGLAAMRSPHGYAVRICC